MSERRKIRTRSNGELKHVPSSRHWQAVYGTPAIQHLPAEQRLEKLEKLKAAGKKTFPGLTDGEDPFGDPATDPYHGFALLEGLPSAFLPPLEAFAILGSASIDSSSISPMPALLARLGRPLPPAATLKTQGRNWQLCLERQWGAAPVSSAVQAARGFKGGSKLGVKGRGFASMSKERLLEVQQRVRFLTVKATKAMSF